MGKSLEITRNNGLNKSGKIDDFGQISAKHHFGLIITSGIMFYTSQPQVRQDWRFPFFGGFFELTQKTHFFNVYHLYVIYKLKTQISMSFDI